MVNRHCDIHNDYREGYNVVGARSFIFCPDREGKEFMRQPGQLWPSNAVLEQAQRMKYHKKP